MAAPPGQHHPIAAVYIRLQPIGWRWLASRRLAYAMNWPADCLAEMGAG
jgi:hypothetical protein